MIPQRVKMSGFLSYKDEQEICFDESPLWMLSGTNGSGKSSVFDALTFALFGHHRGGGQSAVELINKDSRTLTVEFDFICEKQLYRIKRTVQRQKNDKIASTQQVLKYVQTGSGDGEWEALPRTDYKKEFEAWIKDRIGLDYETFTSSVLLLQGKSEKLLDSTPAGRASVLARIVDLERYQKLHGKADERRRGLKAQLEAINNQLAAAKEVTDAEHTEAEQLILAARDARDAAQVRIDHLNSLELRARDWTDTQLKLAAARAKLAAAEKLLGTALAIEKDYLRLRELRDVLPAVSTIVTERGRIGESERASEKLIQDHGDLAERRRQADNDLEVHTNQLAALKKSHAENEVKKARLDARLRELAGILEKVRQLEESESEIKQLQEELLSLPKESDVEARTLQEEQERLALLEQQVAPLERLLRDRTELTKLIAAVQIARTEEAKRKEEGIEAKKECGILEERVKAARAEREAKDSAAAEARALARHARTLANEFQTLSGRTECLACGQPLTPQHFASEKTKREIDADTAENKQKLLDTEAARARKAETELTAQEAAERERLAKLRDAYKDAAAALKHAELEIQRRTESCRHTYFSLPQEYKDRIGPTEPTDWSQTTFPDRRDITELQQQVHGLETVKHKLRAAKENAAKANALQAKIESAQSRVEKLRRSLPGGDPAALREEYSTKQSEEEGVVQTLAGEKKGIETTEAAIRRLQGIRNESDNKLIEIDGKIKLEQASQRQSEEAIDRAAKMLPPEWREQLESAGLSHHLQWKTEYETLQNNDTENRYTQLQSARGSLAALRAEIHQHETASAAFQPEEQRSPEDVRGEAAAARKELEQRQRELLDSESRQRILDERRKQRAELNERCKLVEADHNRHKLLAELLGRDRLQRHLVRQAERQIVDYANAVLDRLSGGQLFLKVVEVEAGTDKALDLECANRVAGGSAINVAFLSGSQRFRVAVALALGIGQYASKQHRPIESVIIDEGFGCLDRAGRQVMIQELQNLRGHLHCILLVSHQEEFADAFPDGYRFELQNGTTKVSRFVR